MQMRFMILIAQDRQFAVKTNQKLLKQSGEL